MDKQAAASPFKQIKLSPSAPDVCLEHRPPPPAPPPSLLLSPPASTRLRAGPIRSDGSQQEPAPHRMLNTKAL